MRLLRRLVQTATRDGLKKLGILIAFKVGSTKSGLYLVIRRGQIIQIHRNIVQNLTISMQISVLVLESLDIRSSGFDSTPNCWSVLFPFSVRLACRSIE